MNKSEKEHTKLSTTWIALYASLLAMLFGIGMVCLIDWWDFKDLGSDYETSPVTNIVGTILLVCSQLIIVGMVGVVIYYFLMRKMNTKSVTNQAKIESLLQGAAKGHEQQIIDQLKSIAKPSASKQHLNRAPTAQFLRALTELGYLDANVSGPNLLAWVEDVTGYKDKDDDSGHFFAAYNKPTKEDTKVSKYMDQIQQIIAQ